MQPEDQRNPEQRYTVVPRTLIFLTRDSQILLLKGAPTKRLWAGKYNGIGGHVEPGETPYRSALRELKEETGLEREMLEDQTLELRGIVHVTLPTPPGVVLFVFVGAVATDAASTEAVATDLTPSEEGMPAWIEQDDLGDLPLVEDLPVLLPRVLAPGPPVFAHYTFSDDGLRITFE